MQFRFVESDGALTMSMGLAVCSRLRAKTGEKILTYKANGYRSYRIHGFSIQHCWLELPPQHRCLCGSRDGRTLQSHTNSRVDPEQDALTPTSIFAS